MGDTPENTEYRKLAKKFVDKFNDTEVSYEMLSDWYVNTTHRALTDKNKIIFLSLLQKHYNVERSYIYQEKKVISILKINKL